MAADYAIAIRFGEPLLDHGFTSIPNLFLEHYAALGITNNEAMFVVQLLSFWWGREHPYPRLKIVAERMGVSWLQAHRYAHSLEEKGLLRITQRFDDNGRKTTNEYDFSSLLKALQAY